MRKDDRKDFETAELPRVTVLESVLIRLQDTVGVFIRLLDDTDELTTSVRNSGIFWASIRLIVPEIEVVAEVMGEERWDFLRDHLDIEAPALTWDMFRNSLLHGGYVNNARWQHKRIHWSMSTTGQGHVMHSGYISIDVVYLYQKLVEFLQAEITKHDQTLVAIKTGIIYLDPPKYIIDEFQKMQK